MYKINPISEHNVIILYKIEIINQPLKVPSTRELHTYKIPRHTVCIEIKFQSEIKTFKEMGLRTTTVFLSPSFS